MTSHGSGFARQQKMLYGIMLAGLLVLLAVNTLAWIYLQRIKTFFIDDLKFRLENIVRISATLVDASDLRLIIPGDESDPTALRYRFLLSEIKDNNRLQDLFILSPSLDMLIDTYPTYRQAPRVEKILTDRARAARISAGEIQSLGDHKFLSAAAPLIDANNLLAGILGILPQGPLH